MKAQVQDLKMKQESQPEEANNSSFKLFLGKHANWSLSFMQRSVYAELVAIENDILVLKLHDGRPLLAAIRTVNGVGLPRSSS
ncbi:MAG TPA: hypothetical protein PK123_07145 [Bacteroidales bacterium]|nr:hypothetical protein [Bacteroidales bacterium]